MNRVKTFPTRITDLLVQIEGRGNPEFKQYVLVLVEEHDARCWSVAGNQLSAAAIRDLTIDDVAHCMFGELDSPG